MKSLGTRKRRRGNDSRERNVKKDEEGKKPK